MLGLSMSREPLTIAAKAYQLPERTLQRWVAGGRLTVIRHGRNVLIDLLELGELVEQQHAGGGKLARTPSGGYDSLHWTNPS
jgi:hypothetical protein